MFCRFPSFQVVGLGQVVATLVALQVLKLSGIVAFPHFSLAPIVKVSLMCNTDRVIGQILRLGIPTSALLLREPAVWPWWH